LYLHFRYERIRYELRFPARFEKNVRLWKKRTRLGPELWYSVVWQLWGNLPRPSWFLADIYNPVTVVLVLDLTKMAPGYRLVPDIEFARFCAFLCVFCALFARFCATNWSPNFSNISKSGFKGPTWTHRGDGALRNNSHLTNPNQFEHVAFKSKSQPGRREKPKKSSKPQKTNEAKIKGTNKDLRYEPRIQVRTRGGAEIKGTMDGSGTCPRLWFTIPCETEISRSLRNPDKAGRKAGTCSNEKGWWSVPNLLLL